MHLQVPLPWEKSQVPLPCRKCPFLGKHGPACLLLLFLRSAEGVLGVRAGWLPGVLAGSLLM